MKHDTKFAEILLAEDLVEEFDRKHPASKMVLTSGGFDPLHPGHISCIVDSANYGDVLVVVVNGDWFLDYKKGRHFMDLKTRCEIVSAIRGVDYVVPFEIEGDLTVNVALETIVPDVFTKGGDRVDASTIPEWNTCVDKGIEIVTGVGDSKIHSSTSILEDWYWHRLRLFMGSHEVDVSA